MVNKINVNLNGENVISDEGITLSEIIKGERPCGGHGKCGKCRVIAHGKLSALTDAERSILSDDEIARGTRLACLTLALGDCEIRTDASFRQTRILTEGIMPTLSLDPLFSCYGVAVDIGTTTIAARLYDHKGELLSEISTLNPQSEWGADVISRIEAALSGGAELLAVSVRTTINNMLIALAQRASICAERIDSIVITGNTVMISLLTKESVEPFSHAPFAVNRFFGETVTAEDLGLSCLVSKTRVYIPPCISAFVGADTVCAILATQLCEGDTAMLVDIGTNGEMALWHNGALIVCSTAAGPAFEGVGISTGMRGAVGAIDKIGTLNGEMLVHVIGDVEPIGICGSGLVDAVAYMLERGIVDEYGYLEDECFEVKGRVSLTQQDIRMLQLAKSAICAGLMTLIKREGLISSDIESFFVAGGFGNYLNKQSAARIGLMQSDLAQKSIAVGNAALTGASMILLDRKNLDKSIAIVKNAEILDLATNSTFADLYMSGMTFEMQ